MNLLKLMVFLTLILLSSKYAVARSEVINVDTTDGVTSFGIQIDFPKHCHRFEYPAVIMVGGTGLYYRNVSLGISGTKRDLVFKDLSDRITEKYCVATVRYDYRGVSCDLRDDAAIKKCLDQDVRATLTAETLLEDIQLVYDTAIHHPKINQNRITMLGHSEGSINIARLISQKSVSPKSVVFFGGVAESPKSLVHWQFVDRAVDQAFAMDTDSDGYLTNIEILNGFESSQFAGLVPVQSLLSPTGFWNRDGLKTSFNFQFQFVVANSLIQPDTEPYIQKGIVFSGFGWWKKWFLDETPVVQYLKDYTGPITYFNGSIDNQAPARKQMEFLAQNVHVMKSIPEFKLFEGKGHCLSSHPQYGPIDLDIANQMVDRMVRDIK